MSRKINPGRILNELVAIQVKLVKLGKNELAEKVKVLGQEVFKELNPDVEKKVEEVVNGN